MTGTVVSNSYPMEIANFSPKVNVVQQSCPMWVPLVENNTFMEDGGQYYIKKYAKGHTINTKRTTFHYYNTLDEFHLRPACYWSRPRAALPLPQDPSDREISRRPERPSLPANAGHCRSDLADSRLECEDSDHSQAGQAS